MLLCEESEHKNLDLRGTGRPPPLRIVALLGITIVFRFFQFIHLLGKKQANNLWDEVYSH